MALCQYISRKLLELSVDVQRRAGSLARTQQLRGADAVHLASAPAIGDLAVVVAVWDVRRAAGVRSSGLGVVPAPEAEQSGVGP